MHSWKRAFLKGTQFSKEKKRCTKPRFHNSHRIVEEGTHILHVHLKIDKVSKARYFLENEKYKSTHFWFLLCCCIVVCYSMHILGIKFSL